MSARLITRNADLRRLRNEGYEVEVRGSHLRMRAVPYATKDRKVARGALVTPIKLNGDTVLPPDDHTIYFEGEFPCAADGSPLPGIRNQTETKNLGDGITVHHRFSSKKTGGVQYVDYYEKLVTYASILGGAADALEPGVTARTFAPVPDSDVDSVFHYVDTASSRAGIGAVSERLAGQVIAIIGVGGTGSYVLDLVAKTHVKEIHLFDADQFLQHNAFRAPGAAKLADLEAMASKADHFARVYGHMRRGIVPHGHLTDVNVGDLDRATFAFICVDKGTARGLAIDRLRAKGIPFIDVGMGVGLTAEKLGGIVRITLVTPQKNDHGVSRIPHTDGGGDYDANIQVAELNALTAAMAVLRWKRFAGIYHDMEGEHNTFYTIDGNTTLNEDHG